VHGKKMAIGSGFWREVQDDSRSKIARRGIGKGEGLKLFHVESAFVVRWVGEIPQIVGSECKGAVVVVRSVEWIKWREILRRGRWGKFEFVHWGARVGLGGGLFIVGWRVGTGKRGGSVGIKPGAGIFSNRSRRVGLRRCFGGENRLRWCWCGDRRGGGDLNGIVLAAAANDGDGNDENE